MADSEKTGRYELLAAVAVAVSIFLQTFVLLPWVILGFAGFELFFRRIRCGVPTRKDRPCRINTRGRWRSCRYESHRRIKRSALVRALRGDAPVPLQQGESGRRGVMPGEGAPLDDPFVSSPLVVRSVTILVLFSTVTALVLTPWAVSSVSV